MGKTELSGGSNYTLPRGKMGDQTQGGGICWFDGSKPGAYEGWQFFFWEEGRSEAHPFAADAEDHFLGRCPRCRRSKTQGTPGF